MCTRQLLSHNLLEQFVKRRSTAKTPTSARAINEAKWPLALSLTLPIPAELKIRLLLKSTDRFELVALLLTLDCHNQRSILP